METDELISLFKSKGHKVTSQRIAICRFILSRKDHPTADQISQGLKNDHPTISLGTIYKTLHLLKEMGLIQELGFEDGSTRFDPDMDLHVNLVCVDCGKIEDYKAKKVQELWNLILSDLDINSEGQRLDLYYKCVNCKKL